MAGPGAGAPEHRTMRGLQDGVVGGEILGKGDRASGALAGQVHGAFRMDLVLLEVPVGGRHGSVCV